MILAILLAAATLPPGACRAVDGDTLRCGAERVRLTGIDALGMSETMVGQMERGQKPIERRTALAALYLAEHPDAAGGNVPEPGIVSIPRLEG